MAGTLKDDFNDGNLDEWTHECARKDLQPCKVRDENWQLKKGQLVAIADPEDRIAMMTIGEDDWKNYTVIVSEPKLLSTSHSKRHLNQLA